jgi:hypothetical protein
MSYERANGPIYTVTFVSTALTANPHDVFGIVPSSNSRVCIHEIVLGIPSSDGTDVGVEIWRGSTGVSTGADITPRNIHGWTAASTAKSAVTGPSSAVVSTTSAVRLYADVTSELRWQYKPNPCDRPIFEVSQPAHVRITAPTTGRMRGAVTFSEIGKSAAS